LSTPGRLLGGCRRPDSRRCELLWEVERNRFAVAS
jgi:hypothetical protein